MPSQTPHSPIQTAPQTSPSTPALCRYIRMSGHKCRAIALKDQAYCYSHGMTHMERRQDRAARPSRRPPTPEVLFRLSNIDNFHIIQAALGAILAGLAANTLGPRRATPILRALSIASRNTAGKVYDPNAPQLTPEQFTAETAAVVRLIGCRRKAKPTN